MRARRERNVAGVGPGAILSVGERWFAEPGIREFR
jgi:hypothetical protein